VFTVFQPGFRGSSGFREWLPGVLPMGSGTFCKEGGTSARQRNIENLCGFNWQLWRHKH